MAFPRRALVAIQRLELLRLDLGVRNLNAYSTSSQGSHLEDLSEARRWYKETFSTDPDSAIPQTLGEISYSRSSGPGGQNVNKINSKAQLRVPVGQLCGHLPVALHPGIRASRYYADKTDSLLFQADESRKATINKDTCYRKLSELVRDVYRAAVPGETSDEQKEKVQKLKKSENEARLKLKKKQSSKKAARSRSSDD
ncbi:uncharacterized protein HMPREF1541_09213 [Cyphellophora europaea CBS 101466]|uniref:Prokaryotic-type class I peptide chain release factors domain-containing protein n=1 Tax=Cyphellophora europaea (strain CBS 101466) TaxID=1220924 RepID=W2S9P3_CYPE1|nr:uncharacterized protein HMPREF1541_09213 [Cyphellophora europaea CBS 101466]ETN45382.1 hypothetical protein HMPREF1541_09213 [Cyphellophora europaea CBS 101466]